VNEQDMGRLLNVEKLIEKPITQLPVPPQFGPFPVYGERKRREDNRGGTKNPKGGNQSKPRKFKKPAARPMGER
jgi:hypothetical protein